MPDHKEPLPSRRHMYASKRPPDTMLKLEFSIDS
ncbi:predicted protein [Plenodomus lingam JN3]|uniref:Predicted protein n=1 Tax=Leptosphaeria maculans (strain JN3 / isolate v23.1.3 / race Av1-4-5-6-7-8) TaxID=985895 RepID=E4ZV65_LEPMJ|nr:predicted protein [Plenodomus lingam JN3]CBX95491.1 predicted protein [Plenodomus lingam JN3]